MGEKKVVSRNIAFALGLLCIILAASTALITIYSGNTDYAATHSHTDAEYAALSAQLTAANENITSLNNQLSALQNEVSGNGTQSTDLQTKVDVLTSQLISINGSIKTIQDYYNSLIYVYTTDNHDLSVELTTANTQIANLQSQINTFNAISNLTVSTVWVNNQTVSQLAGSYTTWPESAIYAGYVSIQVSSTTSSTYANVTYSSLGVNYNTQTNVGANGTAYFPVLPSSNVTVAVGNGLQSGSETENVTITYFY
jgi:peptidoglycan hydrolase CwlO-like protein